MSQCCSSAVTYVGYWSGCYVHVTCTPAQTQCLPDVATLKVETDLRMVTLKAELASQPATLTLLTVTFLNSQVF